MNFWIQRNQCHVNSFYNAKVGGRGYKAYHGQIFKDGILLMGLDVNCSVKSHYNNQRQSHSWCENKKKGTIIDWVINAYLDTDKQKEWTKKELEEQGFEWRYYTEQDAISKHLKKEIYSMPQEYYEEQREMWGEFKIKAECLY